MAPHWQNNSMSYQKHIALPVLPLSVPMYWCDQTMSDWDAILPFPLAHIYDIELQVLWEPKILSTLWVALNLGPIYQLESAASPPIFLLQHVLPQQPIRSTVLVISNLTGPWQTVGNAFLHQLATDIALHPGMHRSTTTTWIYRCNQSYLQQCHVQTIKVVLGIWQRCQNLHTLQ